MYQSNRAGEWPIALISFASPRRDNDLSNARCMDSDSSDLSFTGKILSINCQVPLFVKKNYGKVKIHYSM